MFVSQVGHVSSPKALNKQTVAFKGHNLVSNNEGEKVYHFYLPKVNFDKASLVYKTCYLDDNGNIDESIDLPEISNDIPKDKGSYSLDIDSLDLTDNQVLVYRFVIDGKDYNDTAPYIHFNNVKYNITEHHSKSVITKPQTMYHLMPAYFKPAINGNGATQDKKRAINILDDEHSADDRDLVTTHFTRFDGKLGNITENLDYLKEMGFHKILSTPFFGQDNLSAHKYWTTNPFQITSEFGTMEDYQKLQQALLARSMGILADGAFVNEGLEGMHFRDVLLHGEKSPFFYWFDIDATFPQNPIQLGVLPVSEKAYQNYDIRIVNSPYIWDVTRDGQKGVDFGKKNEKYTSSKPTYIQIYDKRLVTQEQLNSPDLIKKYAVKSLNDKEEINSWMDSVQLYSFPVKPDRIQAKVKSAKQDSSIPVKEYLRDWDYFRLATADKSSGIRLWNGNKDTLKLRLTLPESKLQKIYDEANTVEEAERKIEAIRKANQEVRNYITSIGAYWTKKTADILLEHIALALPGTVSSKVYKNKIDSLAGTYLPEAARNISEQEISKIVDGECVPVELSPVPETIEETLKSSPLEAIEVNDDITSIFASSNFKQLADRHLYSKSKSMEFTAYRIFQMMDDANINAGLYLQDRDLGPVNLKLVRLIADELVRFLTIKALDPNFPAEKIFSYDEESMKMLKKITLGSIGVNGVTQNEKAAQLVSIMKKNINRLSTQDSNFLVNHFAYRLAHINSNKLKVAEYILDKTESGLGWRIDAAKDVAEMDAMLEEEAGTRETWEEAIKIWKDFNDEVSLYNPHAYRIGEVTDSDIAAHNVNERFANQGDLENKFISQTGFTTQTNYSFLFSGLQAYLSGHSELGSAKHDKTAASIIVEKLLKGWDTTPGFLYSGSKNNVAYSHVGVDNHDKPRIADGFSINTKLGYDHSIDEEVLKELEEAFLSHSRYYKRYIAQMKEQPANQDRINQLKEGLFQEIEPLALAKEAAMLESLNAAIQSKNNKNELLEAFTKALDTLASKNNRSGHKFGARPFDFIYDEASKLVPGGLETEFKSLKPAVHQAYTQNAAQRGTELMRLMVALPGTPTVFAGDELLETGGEDKSKNNHLQNRGRAAWERLDNNQYKHVQNYKNTISKILNLRNQKDLSCLVNGDTVVLKEQSADNIIGLYRYNSENDAIILMHNKGFDNSRRKSKAASAQIGKIDLQEAASVLHEFGGREYTQGLPGKLENGSEFVDVSTFDKDGNALYKKYCINAAGALVGVDADGNHTDITLDNAVTILKRVK
ncbi:MAG: alpha-amylase family glycosyl hydrolase [Candidatus Gastranaerophilales bacterium]|nr:alpha-amylase family glycosyl hydrolase [Candidatus Gastranaerophilales bacterium]